MARIGPKQVTPSRKKTMQEYESTTRTLEGTTIDAYSKEIEEGLNKPLADYVKRNTLPFDTSSLEEDLPDILTNGYYGGIPLPFAPADDVIKGNPYSASNFNKTKTNFNEEALKSAGIIIDPSKPRWGEGLANNPSSYLDTYKGDNIYEEAMKYPDEYFRDERVYGPQMTPQLTPSQRINEYEQYYDDLQGLPWQADYQKKKSLIDAGLTPTELRYKYAPKEYADTTNKRLLDAGVGGDLASAAYKGVRGMQDSVAGLTNSFLGTLGQVAGNKDMENYGRNIMDSSYDDVGYQEFLKGRQEATKDRGFIRNLPETLTQVGVQMIPMFATGGLAGIGVTGGIAGGQNAEEALNFGASPAQALTHGAITGTAEAFLEKLLGFAPGTKGVLSGATANMEKNLVAMVKNFLKKSAGEGLEEVAMEPITQISKGSLYDDSISFNPLSDDTYGDNGILPLKRMAEAGLLGSIMGAGVTGASLPSQYKYYKDSANEIGKNIQLDLYLGGGLPEGTFSRTIADDMLARGGSNVTIDEYENYKKVLRNDMQQYANIELDAPKFNNEVYKTSNYAPVNVDSAVDEVRNYERISRPYEPTQINESSYTMKDEPLEIYQMTQDQYKETKPTEIKQVPVQTFGEWIKESKGIDEKEITFNPSRKYTKKAVIATNKLKGNLQAEYNSLVSDGTIPSSEQVVPVENIRKTHLTDVRNAIRQGKEVPAEIKDYYKELQYEKKIDEVKPLNLDEPLKMENRTNDLVGNRKIKAYQQINDAVKPHYQWLAKYALKHEFYPTDKTAMGQYEAKKIRGEVMNKLIATGLTNSQIEDGLNRIIEDGGKENNANAKRVEIVLDDLLSNGFKTFDGFSQVADNEYLDKKHNYEGTEIPEPRKNEPVLDDDLINTLVEEDYKKMQERNPSRIADVAYKPKGSVDSDGLANDDTELVEQIKDLEKNISKAISKNDGISLTETPAEYEKRKNIMKINLQLFSKAEEKLERKKAYSKLYTNTLANINEYTEAERARFKKEHGEYGVITEQESLAEAEKNINEAIDNLDKNFKGEIERLESLNGWTGVDFDTAMGILEVFKSKGHYNRMTKWAKMIRQKGSTVGGQLVQAHAKYSRTPEGAVIASQNAVDKIQDEIKKAKPDIFNSIDEESKLVDEIIKEAEKEAEKELPNEVNKDTKKESTLDDEIKKHAEKKAENELPNEIKKDINKSKNQEEQVTQLAERIIKNTELISNPKTKKEIDAVEAMINELYKKHKETLESNKTTKEIKFSEIAKAIKDRSISSSVWMDARKKVDEYFEDDEEARAILKKYFGTGTRPPFSEQLISSVISDTMKKLNISLPELVKEYYSKGKEQRNELINYIIKNTGLKLDDARVLETYLNKKMNELKKEYSEKYLENFFKDKTVSEPIVKNILKDLEALSNTGGLMNDIYANKLHGKLSNIIIKLIQSDQINMRELTSRGMDAINQKRNEFISKLRRSLNLRTSQIDIIIKHAEVIFDNYTRDSKINVPNELAERIIKNAELIKTPRNKKEINAVDEMINELYKKHKETLPKKNATKKEKYDEIAKAIRERQISADAWVQARKKVDEYFKNDVVSRDFLNKYFGTGTRPPFSEQLLTSVVKDTMKKLDINLPDMVKEYYSKGIKQRGELLDHIIKNTNLQLDDARVLETYLNKKMKELKKEYSEKYLENFFKDKTLPKSITNKPLKDLEALGNTGGLSNTNYADKLYAKLEPKIRKLIVNNNINMRELVSKGISATEFKRDEFISNLKETLELNASQVEIIANHAQTIFNEYATETRTSILNRMFRRNDVKKRKTIQDKVTELIMLDAYSREDIKDMMKEKEGIPILNSTDIESIVEMTEAMNKMDSTSYFYNVFNSIINKIMSDKVPVEFREKFLGYLRISMLSSPTTYAKNFLANAIFNAPIIGLENLTNMTTGAVIDKITSSIRGTKRTTISDLAIPKAQVRGFIQGSKSFGRDFMITRKSKESVIKDMIDAGISEESANSLADKVYARNKYEKLVGRYENIDSTRASSNSELQNKRIFRRSGNKFTDPINDALNIIDTAVKTSLRIGDVSVYEAMKAGRLVELAKSNGTNEITPETLLDAELFALERVFQNNSDMRQRMAELKKSLRLIGDIFIPFVQTPANVFDKLLDYSPLGLIRGAKELGKVNGEFNQKKFVDTLARGINGTGMLILFTVLISKGILSLTGSYDKREKVSETEKENFQRYSAKLTLGEDDYYLSFEGFPPMGSIIAMAAEFSKQEGKGIEAISESLQAGGTVMLSNSMLQGLLSVTSNFNLVGIIGKTASNAINQANPNIFKRLTKTLDPWVRETYDPNVVKQMLNRFLATVPFASKLLPKKINVFGEEIKQSGGLNGVFNVMFNPITVGKYKPTPTQKVIYELFQKAGDVELLPNVATEKISKRGIEYELDTEQYIKYQRLMGEYVESIVSSYIENGFNDYSDEQKIDILKDVMNQSKKQAELQIIYDIEG